MNFSGEVDSTRGSPPQKIPNVIISKLSTCFIDDFTLKIKSQSIFYLLNESEYIQWILNLEGEVHSIWDLWMSGLNICKGNGFSK